MPTWVQIAAATLDFSTYADAAYGAALGGDGFLAANARTAISNGNLLLKSDGGGVFSAFTNYTNPATKLRDQRISWRIPAGDLTTSVHTVKLKVGTNGYMLATVSTAGVVQLKRVLYGLTVTGNTFPVVATSGTPTPNGTSEYRLRVTVTGSLPMTWLAELIDFTNGGTVVASCTLNNDYWEELSGPLNWGFVADGSFGTVAKYAGVIPEQNTDLQAPTLEIVRINGSAGAFTARDITGTGIYTYGGTGNYQFRLHRSTSSGFSPSGATAVTSYSSVPLAVDTFPASDTTYFEVLEVYDGVSSAYSTQRQVQSGPATPANFIIVTWWGHSYVVGSGSSTGSKSLYQQFGTYLAAATGKTVKKTQYAVSATGVTEWRVGGWFLWPAIQELLSIGSEYVIPMFMTNDGSRTGAQMREFYDGLIAQLNLKAPWLKGILIPLMHRTPNNQISAANAAAFASALAGIDDGSRIVLYGHSFDVTFAENAGLFANGAAGAWIASDGIHPFDPGHMVHAMSAVNAWLMLDRRKATSAPQAVLI